MDYVAPQTWVDLARKLVLLWPLCWFIGFAFGWVILQPLRRAARKVSASTQFRLTDFLVLLGVLFVVGWLPVLYIEERRVTQERFLSGMLFLHSLFIAWWWWGLRLLARAEIVSPKVRAVALGLAVPLACGGALGFVAAAVTVAEKVADGVRLTGDVQGRGNDLVVFLYWATKAVPVWALLGLVAFWGGRGLAHWVVKNRLGGEPEEDQPF